LEIRGKVFIKNNIRSTTRWKFMGNEVEDYIYELEKLIALADREKDKYFMQ
jgi:hypothetical protein